MSKYVDVVAVAEWLNPPKFSKQESTCVVFDDWAEGVKKPLLLVVVVPSVADCAAAVSSCSFNVSRLNAAADSAACSCELYMFCRLMWLKWAYDMHRFCTLVSDTYSQA